MQIKLTKAKLWHVSADAVIYPTNSLGIMGSILGCSIRKHGGLAIQREAMAHAPIAIGAAVVTTAGSLLAKQVVHVPIVEEPGMPVDGENIRRALRAALVAAERLQLATIAMPVLSTEAVGSFDEISAWVLHELLAYRRDVPRLVHIVDQDQRVLDELDDVRGMLASTGGQLA